MLSEDELFYTLLGNKGRTISHSKRLGPPLAVYNARVSFGYDQVWYGDIDLELAIPSLKRLNETLRKHIVIRAQSSDTIAWQSSNPDTVWGMDYHEALEKLTKHSVELREQWMKDHGLSKEQIQE